MSLGAGIQTEGVNFAVFSRDAESMTLCLFEASTDGEASFEYRLDPRLNKTGDIWHVLVVGLGAGALYLWRAEGPSCRPRATASTATRPSSTPTPRR